MVTQLLKRNVSWTLTASLLICILGFFTPLQEGEAARMAAMSVKLWKSGPFDGPYHPDFAGQPVLIIWIFAFFTRVFGENHIAYRLPGLISICWALYSVSHFCKIYFSIQIRRLSVIIFASAAGTFFLLQDVRSETFLMAFYIFTIWQATLYHRYKRLQNLVLAVLGALLLIFSRTPLDKAEIHFVPISQLFTLALAFLPWTIFLILGLVQNVNVVFQKAKNGPLKDITLYTFLIPLLLLCLNPYPAGYNVLILVPIGSVVAAGYLAGLTDDRISKRIYYVQILFSYALLAALFCLVWFPFPENNYFGLIHYMALLAIFSWLVFFSRIQNRLIVGCILLASGGNLVLNSYYYPNMLQYQAGSQLGMIARTWCW